VPGALCLRVKAKSSRCAADPIVSVRDQQWQLWQLQQWQQGSSLSAEYVQMGTDCNQQR
jgi:hypothetical protein